ncbi:MAG: Ig-like domain-containing protein [Leptospiraceae bacterium]|nr:Ig-like domain-containing protein [Leptospiraceae bacterium]
MKTQRILVLVLFLAQCMISPIDNMDSRTIGGALYRLLPFLLPKKSTTPPSVIATNAIVGEEKFSINRKVYAIFNKEIKLNNDSALEIYSGRNKILGKVSVEKNTIKFTPDSLFPKDVKLTATIYKNGIVDSASNSMETDFSFSFETGSQSDLTLPLVASVSPLKGARSVGTNTEIAIEFSENMEPSTLTSENLELYEGTEKIAVTLSYAGNIISVKPSRTLAASTSYILNVKKAVQDSAGNSMSSDFTSTFTTGGGTDTTPPTVSAIFPTNASTDIPTTQRGIILIFSEVLYPLSITKNSISIKNSLLETVSGSFSRFSNTIVFYPSANLEANLTYTIKVNNEIKDLAGNFLVQEYTSTFSTVSYLSPDSTPPPTFTMSSISSNVTSGQTGVNPSANISLNFPEAIDSSSVNGSSITLVDSAGNVITGAFTFTNDNLSVVFDPSVDLSPNTTYTISVLAGIKTLSGKRLSSTFTLSFTTGAANLTTGGTVSSASYPWGTFSDMGNGTIRFVGVAGVFGGQTYAGDTLYFAKCSMNQNWDSVNNTCTGSVGQARYCSATNNSCNDLTTMQLNGTGTSQAWDYCNSLNLAGRLWRVPTKNELKLTILCSNPTILSSDNGSSCASSPAINTTLFPNTATANCRYWTATASSTTDAWFINYCTGVAISNNNKDAFNYIRCVSTGP